MFPSEKIIIRILDIECNMSPSFDSLMINTPHELVRNHLPRHVLCAATGPFFSTRQKENERVATEGRYSWILTIKDDQGIYI